MSHPHTRLAPTLACALLAPLACTRYAFGIDAYSFTVNQTTSTLTYSFNASAPFTGTMIGANDATTAANMLATRTKHMANIFSCGAFGAAQNDSIGISGAIAANGSSSGQPAVHPGGTFKLAVNPGALTCVLQDFNVNLVAAGSISAPANLTNFRYDSPGFCTANPSCSNPYLAPLTIPLGTVSVTALQTAQDPGVPSSGTLTANGANSWNFSVDTMVTVTPTVSFQGAPIAADPQVLPVTITGTVTVNGSTVTATASVPINYNPPANTTPAPQPASPFTTACPTNSAVDINLILTLTITSSTVGSTDTATLNAAGTRIVCRCDTNADGAVTIQDLFDFLSLWFAHDPRADFNGAGGITVQDLFDYLSCWFARPLGC